MNRTVFTLILAAALAASVCSCSSGVNTAAEETAAPEASVQAGEEAAAPETEAPAETTAPAVTESPAETTEPLVEADHTWGVIQQYGFENGYSVLSYEIDSETLGDCGDFYSVFATLYRGITVPADMAEGDQVTVTFSELTGEQRTITRTGEYSYVDDQECEYYSYENAVQNGEVTLYQDSDDRVECSFRMGEIRINKDAQTGAQLINDIHTVTADDLADNPWFNAVAFDENGYVTELIFVGD